MRISMRSALFVAGGLGLAYALSPKVRAKMDPSIRSAARYTSKMVHGYGGRRRRKVAAAIEDLVPVDGMEDLKAFVRSFSRRLSDIERAVTPSAADRTNEYHSAMH